MSREELEKLWHRRVQEAKLRLDFARNYAREVQQDLQAGVIHPADGEFARRRALEGESAALANYQKVLRIYDDLLVHGKIPDDDSKSESAGDGD